MNYPRHHSGLGLLALGQLAGVAQLRPDGQPDICDGLVAI